MNSNFKKRKYSKGLVKEVHKWLGEDGLKFFRETKENYGEVNAVYPEPGIPKIPHAVHFREGMQVRNFLRSLDECKDWDAHELDNTWADIIEAAIL